MSAVNALVRLVLLAAGLLLLSEGIATVSANPARGLLVMLLGAMFLTSSALPTPRR